MLRLAFATLAIDADHGGERARLQPLLGAFGIAIEAHAWDDPAVDWASYDGVVVKSTWDYVEHVEEFLAWIEHVDRSTRLANPASVLTWNVDKRYLLDLSAAGVPIIDTRIVAPGEPVALPAWPEVVVKPSVSAGGRLSGRFAAADGEAAHRLAAAIHAEGKTVMLQPYLEAVDGPGEQNVLVLGGTATHAIAKGGILASGFEPDLDSRLYLGQSIAPIALDDELVAFARVVLDAVTAVTGVAAADLVHARVDSAVDADGTRRLMEAELIEPYLYFEEAADPTAAATVYAAALHRWLADG